MVAPEAITIARRGTDPVRVFPEHFQIDADAFGIPADQRFGAFQITVDDGWSVEPVGELRWGVKAHRIDIDCPLSIVLRRDANLEWTKTIPVRLDLRSTFDPIEHTFPEPNRASVLGDILPDRDIFEQTFAQPAFLKEPLFAGLYSDIVFLRRDGPTRGGLCNGMARWAIARGVGDEPHPANRDEALERITTYHGRQLKDRAFLVGAPWFFRASPRASYRAVRRDLLFKGWTDRAFDVAIPKPWRRDVISALIGQGHTVVPYRLMQADSDSARVEVYDPNRPPATIETPEAVVFDLKNDRYAYRHMVSMDQSNVGLVAARQAGYADRGTAILAGLASVGLCMAASIRKFGQKSTRTAGRPGIDFTA